MHAAEFDDALKTPSPPSLGAPLPSAAEPWGVSSRQFDRALHALDAGELSLFGPRGSGVTIKTPPNRAKDMNR